MIFAYESKTNLLRNGKVRARPKKKPGRHAHPNMPAWLAEAFRGALDCTIQASVKEVSRSLDVITNKARAKSLN